ncbi:MAG: hypothetical protein IKV85_10920 [Ruminococcus sp.]|nr:hypothetical protein [Ruminococcus sp.]
MAQIKYKLVPQDVATYLYLSNFTHRKETEIISNLFEEYNDWIVCIYRNDYLSFKQSIMNLISLFEVDFNTYSEAELIMKEVDGADLCDSIEVDYFGAYFKLIRLQLMYSDISYRKIKLRTLLRDFGYKRRSEKLIDNMLRAIKTMNLTTYLRGYETCDIRNVSLDDMIIIRISDK